VPSVIRGSRVLNGRIDPQCIVSNYKQRVTYSFPQSRCTPVLYVQVLNGLDTLFIDEAYQNDPFVNISPTQCVPCRCQWSRGLRRGSAAARLLAVWVRTPPKTWMFASSERCVLSGRGLCIRMITFSGGVLPSVLCVWVWSWSLKNKEDLAHWSCCAMWGEKIYLRGNQFTNVSCILYYVGRRSVFGTVTGYGLDVRGIESACGRYLPHLSRPVLGLTHLPIQWVPVHTPGVKRPGLGADRPSPI
jgi:hypothetical protein